MSSFTSLIGDSELNRIFGSDQQGIGPGLEGTNALGAASGTPGVSGNVETPGTGPGSNATNWGTYGGIAGTATGVLGGGLVGNALGTAVDVSNFNDRLAEVGAPKLGFMEALSAFANNATFGLAGRTLDQSFARTDLSGTPATAGLNTNDPEAANSANASGGMHGVGETMDSGQTQDANESGGSRGVGESAAGVEGYGGNSDQGGHEDADTGGSAEGGGHEGDSEGGSGGDAKGGLIRGPGTGTSDSITKQVSDGEFVATAKAVKMFGVKLYDTLNVAAARGEKLQIIIHRPVDHDPFKTKARPVDHDPFAKVPLEGARLARDGNWYLPHPTQAGAFLQVMPKGKG